uniref:Uncharacterized protein n=1 Tax=Rhizophora mucronata TaxID=61149 RepID=A0A2P2NED1_RHIMU
MQFLSFEEAFHSPKMYGRPSVSSQQ